VLCNDNTGAEKDGDNELDDVNSDCDYSKTSTAVHDVITTAVKSVTRSTRREEEGVIDAAPHTADRRDQISPPATYED
jgi:hypothetical protein